MRDPQYVEVGDYVQIAGTEGRWWRITHKHDDVTDGFIAVNDFGMESGAYYSDILDLKLESEMDYAF